LSALLPMRRTAILLAVLAVFAAAGVRAVPITPAAKSQRRSPAAAGVRTGHRPSSRVEASRNVTSHRAAPARTYASATHKPTPDEVGRAAGLAIRRQLAQRHTAWRNAAYRANQARAVYRPVSERTARHRETISAEPIADASASPSLSARPSEADEDESIEPQSAGTQATQFPAQREAARRSEGIASSEVALADRPALPTVAPERDLAPVAAESSENLEGDRPARNNASHSSASTIPPYDADAKTETGDASLQLPRGAMPAPLLGSLASLERQNERAEAEGLERIEDEADLADRIAHKQLVPVPVSSALAVNADLPQNHRYCRPWTASFLADLAKEHEASFHKPLEVSSAVRTVEYQKKLMRINGNAAPAEGDMVSPHETGATVDIAKSGLSRQEIAWMRQRLLELETAGKIDVEEEFKQACFHITVYKSYAPPEMPQPASQAKTGRSKTRHRLPTPVPGLAAAQGA